jgi:hypothetical protein
VIGLPDGIEESVQTLAQRADRDIGFVEFRRDNRRAALGAWRIAPIFVADIEDTNYSTAETERLVTKEQVFDPEQERTADLLTSTLLADLGYDALAFKFTELKVTSDDAQRQSADSAADRGVLTNAEYRGAHGYEPLPEAKEGEDAEPGQVPFGWNSQLVGQGPGPATPVPEEETEPEGGEEPPLTPDELGEGIEKSEGLFREGIDDAVRRVAELAGDDFRLRPVVVEKRGESIVVSPYSGNGAGHS